MRERVVEGCLIVNQACLQLIDQNVDLVIRIGRISVEWPPGEIGVGIWDWLEGVAVKSCFQCGPVVAVNPIDVDAPIELNGIRSRENIG